MQKMVSFNEQIGQKDFSLCLCTMGNLGPTPILSDINMDHFRSYNMLAKMAVYYTTALGQGDFWHTGLYGPFPVPSETELLSLNYAFLINDPTNTDPRNAGKSYCILSIIYPRQMDALFNNRKDFEKIIESQLQDANDLLDINEDVLLTLKKEIVTVLN